jgi:hypothetical protein
MELNDIVPCGRSFDEYRLMFGLTDDDLAGPILGCGDGPASFNVEATQSGHSVAVVATSYEFQRADNHSGNRMMRISQRGS